MKLPAIQFYVGDWRKDPGVQSLGYHDRGIWFEILCLMHESENRGVLLLNGAPMPEDALARVLGLDKQILTTTLTSILDYGVASRRQEDGALYSRRMVRDEKLRKIRTEAGKQGGNPVLLKQNSTTKVNQKPTTKDKQKTTPSSSSSSSSSSSTSNLKFFSSDHEAVRLAELLLNLILSQKPDLKKPNLQTWAKDIDKMIRLDGRTPERIEPVIRWVQQDQFWQSNILSPRSLHKHFDTLEKKMRGPSVKGQSLKDPMKARGDVPTEGKYGHS
jgi:hypothetical protein